MTTPTDAARLLRDAADSIYQLIGRIEVLYAEAHPGERYTIVTEQIVTRAQETGQAIRAHLATPRTWSATVGTEYGHVPGHNYHDVEVTITEKAGRWSVRVLETWGSAQGYDEEHGRHEVVGRGDTLAEAERDARELAMAAEIHPEYFVQALSQAAAEADS